MDAKGRIYALLYEVASVLCKSPSGDFNPTASSLRSFPMMKTIALNLHMRYLPGFSGLNWWGIAWLSVPPAARRWLGRLTHPKIWLTGTNVKSVLLQAQIWQCEAHMLGHSSGSCHLCCTIHQNPHFSLFFLFWCQSLNELNLEEEFSLILFLPHQENDWQDIYLESSRQVDDATMVTEGF